MLTQLAGEFGVVYRAYLSGWEDESFQIVAVKTLKGMCVAETEGGWGDQGKAYILENVVKQCSDLQGDI